ncbi:MAG TPA: hypothetical protein PK993_00775 [Clostridia bacterium]|nr:hypothetical protein [Clostridia bacterium]
MNDYNDIINLSRPNSKRSRMSLEQRSAQFASFAALSGFEEQVKEKARLTSKRVEIDEEIKAILDMKLKVIKDRIKSNPEVEITYFIPDDKKDGGKYVTIKNTIIKLDYYNRKILTAEGTRISLDEIIDIQSEIFNGINF